MNNAKKLLLAPRVIWHGARSFWSWLMLWLFRRNKNMSPTEAQDLGRLRYFFGWLSPDMADHWGTYRADPSFHNSKNLGSKWTRLDPQRAYKLFSAIIIFEAFMLVASIATNITQAVL